MTRDGYLQSAVQVNYSEIAQAISILLFAWYGLSCFISQRTVAEFEHYRLPHVRLLTGALQLAGSAGLVLGHFYAPLRVLSAGGLATMMFLALLTRFRIRDPLYLAFPSFALCVANVFIVVVALRPR